MNLDLLVISSLVYCESSALDNTAIQAEEIANCFQRNPLVAVSPGIRYDKTHTRNEVNYRWWSLQGEEQMAQARRRYCNTPYITALYTRSGPVVAGGGAEREKESGRSNESAPGNTSLKLIFNELRNEGSALTRLKGYEPTFAWRESGKPFRKTTPSSPDRDSNLNLPVLGSLAQHESSALANYATEAVADQFKAYYCPADEGKIRVRIPIESTETCVLSRSLARSSLATSRYNQCVLFYILVTHALARTTSSFLPSYRVPSMDMHVCHQYSLWAYMCVLHSPLSRRICAIERIPQFDHFPVLLLELSLVLHVELHQLGQGGKLLTAVQIVKVTCVLDFNVVKLHGTVEVFGNDSANACRYRLSSGQHSKTAVKLGFLDRRCYFFIQVAPQFVLTRLSPDLLLHRKSVSGGDQTWDL
uniref:Uncharacterized protein n=1 Tax=Timema tahoe TaxID=61484 RepID=A0A7R9II76_9NEOP|nr:unnamed protein product [Timema tahoe]